MISPRPGRFPRLAAAIATLAAALVACRTPASDTRERTRKVERGLLRAVYLKGERVKPLRLEERMAFYRVPAAGLAVLDGSRVEWARTYGIRDAVSRQPADPETVFQAGALGRPLAAATALALADRGFLDLDADVNGILREGRVEPRGTGPDSRPLTVRRLLAGDSGLFPQALRGYPRSEPVPTLEDVLRGRPPAANLALDVDLDPAGAPAPPSFDQDYALLQKVLEAASGKPFPDLARELVIAPAGLTRTAFAVERPASLAGDAASGATRDGELVAGGALAYPAAAALGLWTTPGDLARFVEALLACAAGGSRGFLSAASAREMLTPRAAGRGLGVSVSGSGHDLRFGMRGATAGFAGELVAYPYRGQGVVVLTNSDNGFVLVEEVLRAVSAAYEWPDFKPEEKRVFRLDPSLYQGYAGRYEVNPEYGLDVSWEDYALVIRPTGQAPTRFYVENPTFFFSTDPYIRIQFLLGPTGAVTGLVLWQQDFKLEARKVS